MWTRKSYSGNGEMTSDDYLKYCTNLDLSGYTGWRLPTVDQLAAIYDVAASRDKKGKNIKGGISLGWGQAPSGWTFQDSRDYEGKPKGRTVELPYSAGWPKYGMERGGAATNLMLPRGEVTPNTSAPAAVPLAGPM